MYRTILKSFLSVFTVVVLFGSSIVRAEPLATKLSMDSELKGKGNPKISSLITSILEKMKSMGVTRSNVQDTKPQTLSTPFIKVDGSGDIQVYIYVNEVNDENLAQLKALGVRIEITNAKYKIIQGWVPFDKIEEVANLSFVKKITPPSYGQTQTGSVNTEGDAILGSDEVRDTLGFDGTGVRVGVISDGVENMEVSQALGDLPNDIDVNPSLPGSGDEGTAMLEIVHDIAPGADLAFSDGFSTSLAFIESINYLVNTANVDVIVDDVTFFLEPYFEDGMIAQEAADAITQGVVFVSSAGNQANNHYQAMYVDTSPADENINLHDFGLAAGEASDIGMTVLIPPLQTVVFFLQWNDKFGQSSNDYDLGLFDPVTLDLIAGSANIQNGDDDPIEVVSFTNFSFSNVVPVLVAINRFSGQARTLEMFFIGLIGNLNLIEYNVPSDSIFGHHAGSGVITVGAVPANSPNMTESYSSQGPASIFFPSFESRSKPDVVAPDGVSITGAGGFSNPFFGTSAAAPHVAGVVALMLQANPNLTPSQISNALNASSDLGFTNQSEIPIQVANALKNTAIDLGSPGFDNIYGSGRVNAFAAVQSVSQQPTPTPTLSPSPSPTPNPTSSPLPTPSPQPTISATPTPTTSNPPNGDSGGGSCSIGAPVQFGPAVANILIPLICVLAIAFRMLKRKR
jgi:subtilisin family serine protease